MNPDPELSQKSHRHCPICSFAMHKCLIRSLLEGKFVHPSDLSLSPTFPLFAVLTRLTAEELDRAAEHGAPAA